MKDLTALEKYRLREDEFNYYGKNGDEHNGIFKVFVKGKSFFVIASDGGEWEHVSVSTKSGKIPTWEEMCAIKDMFFEAEEVVMQLHPAKSNYVNIATNCLHLWRPLMKTIPLPPIEFV